MVVGVMCSLVRRSSHSNFILKTCGQRFSEKRRRHWAPTTHTRKPPSCNMQREQHRKLQISVSPWWVLIKLYNILWLWYRYCRWWRAWSNSSDGKCYADADERVLVIDTQTGRFGRGDERLTVTYSSWATVSVSSQWHARSALDGGHSPVKGHCKRPYRPPCPRFSLICVNTMYLLQGDQTVCYLAAEV